MLNRTKLSGILHHYSGIIGYWIAFFSLLSCNNVPTSDYVNPQTCISCHPKEFAEWKNSHHDLAMQVANDSTVLGNFDETTFSHFGVESRFFKKDGKFYVNTEGAEGYPADFEIKYTFGFTPLQQYLIEFPGGRLQCLGIAWDTLENRWFHLYPDEKIAHNDPLHWTGTYQNWNHMCAECHSTNLQKNYDFTTDSYRTTWDVIDVSCQACHGPGTKHLEWAKVKDTPAAKNYKNTGLFIDYKTSPWQTVDNCAPCHSRRSQITHDDQVDRPYLDNFVPSLLREGLYFPDGQILDEVYVYGSFLQSKMYQAGVTCMHCHNPHSLKLKLQGNALCTQCHQPLVNPAFPGLPLVNYDSPTHHFHKLDSAGASCVACHMPGRTYMIVDPRRDHSMKIPRPDLSLALGVPNACNGCHADKSTEWALSFVEKWYGTKKNQEKNFAETIALARNGNAGTARTLVPLVADSTQPAIVRATALELIEGTDEQSVAVVHTALNNQEPLIRATAAERFSHVTPQGNLSPLLPLLSDSIRAVRIEAARGFALRPDVNMDSSCQDAYQHALVEYKESQFANADKPSSLMNLAIFFEHQQKADSAIFFYQKTIARDPYFSPAYLNLANLYSRMQQNSLAEQTLRTALKFTPTDGQCHYSLGLLLAEANRLQDAVQHLALAVKYLPAQERILYNYALALQKLQRRDDAESAFLKAFSL
ncbi:tetratricopeptide repeat protein, partial [candidate division KSB1 bacterium]|nr:tetratricopeptide repeat protein [candidate division KSB1 bacterium]